MHWAVFQISSFMIQLITSITCTGHRNTAASRTCACRMINSANIFLLIILVSVLLQSDEAAAQGFRQEALTSSKCGQTLYVNRPETLRLVPSSISMCGESEEIFECDVYIEAGTFSSDKLCVDISRIYPRGENSKLTVLYRRSAYHSGTIATRDISTSRDLLYSTEIECRNASDLSFVLHFKSDCNGSLSDYFPSWIYAYIQTEQTGELYHLDGSCKHRVPVQRSDRITVRSFIWKDTLGEPPLQKCSLHITTSSFAMHDDNVICPTWNFTHGHPPCSISVLWNKMAFFTHLGGKTIASCTQSSEDLQILNQCTNELYFDVIIQVERNRQSEEKWQLEEQGYELFIMTAVIAAKKKPADTFNSGSNYGTGSGNDNRYSFVDDDDNSGETGPLAKIFLGVSAVGAFICGVCSVARKVTKKNNQGDELSAPLQHQMRNTTLHIPPNNQETLLMQRMGGHSHPSTPDLGCSRTGHSSYINGTESADQNTHAYQWTSTREATAPSMPGGDANAPPSYDEVVTLPPDVPPPPAYKDLFPSNV